MMLDSDFLSDNDFKANLWNRTKTQKPRIEKRTQKGKDMGGLRKPAAYIYMGEVFPVRYERAVL